MALELQQDDAANIPPAAAPPEESVAVSPPPRGPGFLRRSAPWVVDLVLIVLVIAIARNAVNYISTTRPFVDSGVFASMATHLKAGKAPYRDIWDHKLPGVHLLDWLALSLGDGTMHSIHVMERGFAIAAALMVFLIVRIAFSNSALAFLFALLLPFHLYNPAMHEGGNLTEGYACVLVLAMILLLVAARRLNGFPAALLILMAGVFGGAATLFKEPFVFSAAAWFAFVVFGGHPSLSIPKRIAAFVIGGLLPLLALIAWMNSMGALADWMDVFSYNRQFAAMQTRETNLVDILRLNLSAIGFYLVGTTTTMRILLVLGLLSIFSTSFRQTVGRLPIFAAIALLMDFGGTMVSAQRLPHYYMQTVPSFLLLAACGGAFLVFALQKLGVARAAVAVAIAFSFIMFDGKACADFALRMKIPWAPANPELTPIVRYIREHSAPGDTLWAGSAFNSRFYIETGLLSPTKYHYLLDFTLLPTHASTLEEKRQRIAADLQRARPKFILGHSGVKDVFDIVGIKNWVAENYEIVSVREGAVSLYQFDEGRQHARERRQMAALLAVKLPPDLAAVDTALDQLINLRLTDVPLRSAVESAARLAGLAVEFPDDAACAEKVNVAAMDQTLLRTLEDLLVPLHYDFEPVPGGIRVVKPDESTSPDSPPRRRQSNCLEFDGQTSSVVIPFAPVMNSSDTLTAEAWIFYRGPSSALVAGILSRDVPQTGPFVLDVTPDGRFLADFSWGGGWVVQSPEMKWPLVPQNRWVHVALVSDGKEMRLYVDGKPAVRHVYAGPLPLGPTSCPLMIGRKLYNGTTFNGRIDEVRLSNVARYTAPFKPAPRFQPDEATICLYHFDINGGTDALDASGRGLNGEIRGARSERK